MLRYGKYLQLLQCTLNVDDETGIAPGEKKTSGIRTKIQMEKKVHKNLCIFKQAQMSFLLV